MIQLKDFPTRPPENADKGEIKDRIKALGERLYRLHTQLMANGDRSVLVVIQGLDAAGKDGVVRDLMEYLNPVGVSLQSFKKPTEEEYSHNFLWRVQRALPPHGTIGFFIRSHYEDILVPGVEGYLPEEVIARRFAHINAFESLIQDHELRIIKVFLNVSPDEQKERLLERIQLERKRWKHNDRDWQVRANRTEYIRMYERIFNNCNQPAWDIVPADTNWWKCWAVMQRLVEELEAMELTWPALDSERFIPDESKPS